MIEDRLPDDKRKVFTKLIHDKELELSSVKQYSSRSFNDYNDPMTFFTKLNEDNQIEVMAWALNCLKENKSSSQLFSSNRLKHIFEHSPRGFYMTDGEFSGAMFSSGFTPMDYGATNWKFRISKMSVQNSFYWRENGYYATPTMQLFH